MKHIEIRLTRDTIISVKFEINLQIFIQATRRVYGDLAKEYRMVQRE